MPAVLVGPREGNKAERVPWWLRLSVRVDKSRHELKVLAEYIHFPSRYGALSRFVE